MCKFASVFFNLIKMRKLFTNVVCAVSLLAVSVPVGANAVESVRQDADVVFNNVARISALPVRAAQK